MMLCFPLTIILPLELMTEEEVISFLVAYRNEEIIRNF